MKVGATLVFVIVIRNCWLVTPPAPRAVTVLVVTAVGPTFVPEINPLVRFMESPKGRGAAV